jgi:hypothetical protein
MVVKINEKASKPVFEVLAASVYSAPPFFRNPI